MHQATASKSSRLWTVILAAGEGRRFGGPKQLARFGGASLLVGRARLAAAITPGRVVVVVGAHGQRLRSHLRRHGLQVSIVHNAAWRQGLSASLRRGVAALPRRASAAMILLCDQPGVGATSVSRLVRAWTAHPDRIAASVYGGIPGVPAIFPRTCFRTLTTLTGDSGARGLLRAADASRVAMPEAAWDIDERADLARSAAR
jgi:CTP:molybdopterin cytidylyltransferase MocA